VDIISKLLEKMNTYGVRYVHWKSNTNIDCALSGEDDFDVLVAPQYKDIVESFFEELKITRAFSDKDSWQDDIFHYIGFDSNYLKLAHVHVHYNLPVGYDFDKNFKLPIVDSYLTNPIKYKNVLIPEVEKEYIVLVIRLVLKNALTPFLLMLPTAQMRLISQSNKNGVIGGGGYREFIDLKSRADHERVNDLISNEFNFISLSTFKYCESVLSDNRSLLNYFKAGRKLKRELTEFRNNSELKSIFLSFCRINKGRIDKVIAKVTGVVKAKKKPSTGGRIIAFVGGDGAGKSTNIEKLRKQLSRHFWVETVHVGRPPKSILGVFWKILSRFSSLLGYKDLSKALFFVAWAADRQSAFNYACNIRKKGGIAILDRIPLPGITVMDCPRVATVNDGQFKRLISYEKSIYNKIAGVDLLFVLKLDPEVALQRRPEDDADELRIRSGQIWNNNWHAPYAIEINTGENTFEQVETSILKNVGQTLHEKYIFTEIIGLPGAGKSTLLKLIKETVPNTSTTIPFKSYPLLTLLGVFKSTLVSIKIFLKTEYFQCFKNVCQFYASVEIFKYWNKKGTSDSKNYILDQGLIFQLALILKEKGITPTKANEFIDVIRSRMPTNYMLKVDDATLWERTRQRDKHSGRGQECNSKETFLEFLSEYKVVFNDISNNTDLINVLDANNDSPKDVKNKLLEALDFAK
jgi:thymidylate kinase